MQYYSAAPYYYYPSYGYIQQPYGGYQHYLPSPPPSPQMAFNFMEFATKTLPNPGMQTQNQFQAAAVDLTLQPPPPKRRRLTSESSVNSVSSQGTLQDASNRAAGTPTISNASFIQQAFTPPTATDIDMIEKIDKHTLNRLMPYHSNMVRKFPKKERTAKEQERRDKNTLACRITRCKEKIKLAAMQQQYNFCTQRTNQLNKEMIPMAKYLNELIRHGVTFKPDARNELVTALGKTLNYENLTKLPIQKSTKRNFSIAFLLGLEE